MAQDVTEGRNPTWTRDELILALDLYVSSRGSQALGKTGKPVVELSNLLNKLRAIDPLATKSATFRNPAGVYMKLMNFRSFDPAYLDQGKTGLSRSGALDKVIWDEFAGDQRRLHDTARAIKENLTLVHTHPDAAANADFDETDEASEGGLLSRQHTYRERNRKIVAKRKAQAISKHKTLRCEVCGFDFKAAYGDRGEGYIECHHIQPLESLEGSRKTRLEDLALVCANCHRMIHAKRPWLSISDLRAILAASKG